MKENTRGKRVKSTNLCTQLAGVSCIYSVEKFNLKRVVKYFCFILGKIIRTSEQRTSRASVYTTVSTYLFSDVVFFTFDQKGIFIMIYICCMVCIYVSRSSQSALKGIFMKICIFVSRSSQSDLILYNKYIIECSLWCLSKVHS